MNDKIIRLIENDMQDMKKLNKCVMGVSEKRNFKFLTNRSEWNR